jgi:hypothetical protein
LELVVSGSAAEATWVGHVYTIWRYLFKDLDELLSLLFSMVRKINGDLYPSKTINNILNGYNQMICQASKLKAVEGRGQALENFDIWMHYAFLKTTLTIRAVVQKSDRKGKIKKQ